MHRTFLKPLAQLVAITACAAIAPAQGFQPLQAPLGISGVVHSISFNGSGMCVADFDGDRDMDVIVAPFAGLPFRYFRNDGGMQFTDLSATCGLGTAGIVLCMAAADIDNDGDQDVWVGADFQPGQLFINNGNGVFTEEAALRGISNSRQNYGVTFGDYDRDGWLDLYLGNRYDSLTGSSGGTNKLYRNLGNGTFQDVTQTAGVAGNALTLCCCFMDFDEDGWPDIMEVNDKGNVVLPNDLYRNNGNGTFTSVAAQYGAQVGIHGMSIDFADAFNDGGVDYYCTDLPPDHLFQVWDPGLGAYYQAQSIFGVEGGDIGWAAHFLDFDNDGWQDLYVVQDQAPNKMFQNPGAPVASGVAWPDVAPTLGIDFAYRQYTTATADFDDDGRVDILHRFEQGPVWLAYQDGVLLTQNLSSTNNWLKFDLEGTVSNRDALGARIEVTTGSHHQRQWVRSGTGYVSGSDPRVHFGLGTATVVDRVKITWPSGQVQHLTNVAANQILVLQEPHLEIAGPVIAGGPATTLEGAIPGDDGLLYLMFLANTDVPLPLPDGTILPLWPDGLTSYTLSPGNTLLPNSIGIVGIGGTISSPLSMPAIPGLPGLTLYASAVTLDMPTFPWVRTVFPTANAFTVQ